MQLFFFAKLFCGIKYQCQFNLKNNRIFQVAIVRPDKSGRSLLLVVGMFVKSITPINPKTMKKLSLLLTVLLCATLSCTNDQPEKAQVKMYKQDVSTEFKSVVTGFLSSSSGRIAAGRVAGDGEEIIEFDVDNMQAISTDENSTFALVANQIGFSLDNTVNYGLAFYADGNSLVAGAIIKTTKNIDGTKVIDFFALDGTPLVKTVVNEQMKTANSEYLAGSESGRTEGDVVSGAPTNCGQKAMNCFNDVYTQNGWLSLTLTVISIVEPAVAGGVLAGCAVACLASPRGYQIVDPNSPTISVNNLNLSPAIKLTSTTSTKTTIAVKTL
jgi:hypothetical protein